MLVANDVRHDAQDRRLYNCALAQTAGDVEVSFKDSITNMRIYVLINRSWGEVDWILPVLWYLNERGLMIEAIFIHHEVYRYGITDAKEFMRGLRDCCHKIHHPGGFLKRMPWSERIKHARGALRKASRDGKSGLSRLSHALIPMLRPTRANQRHFKIGALADYVVREFIDGIKQPGCVFVDDTFLADARKKRGSYYRLIDHLSSDTVVVFPHTTMVQRSGDNVTRQIREFGWQQVMNLPLDRRVLYLSTIAEAVDAFKWDDNHLCLYTGNPRYQRYWAQRFIDTRVQESTSGTKKRVMVLTKYSRKKVQAYRTLHSIIFNLLRETGCEIILKPHPRTPNIRLQEFLAELGGTSVRIIHDPVMTAAQGVDIVITMPGSASVDAVAAGAVVVEYCDWSILRVEPMLLSAQTNTTVHNEMGLVHAVTSERELRQAVQRLLKDRAYRNEVKSRQQRALSQEFDTGRHAGELVYDALFDSATV